MPPTSFHFQRSVLLLKVPHERIERHLHRFCIVCCRPCVVRNRVSTKLKVKRRTERGLQSPRIISFTLARWQCECVSENCVLFYIRLLKVKLVLNSREILRKPKPARPLVAYVIQDENCRADEPVLTISIAINAPTIGCEFILCRRCLLWLNASCSVRI